MKAVCNAVYVGTLYLGHASAKTGNSTAGRTTKSKYCGNQTK